MDEAPAAATSDAHRAGVPAVVPAAASDVHPAVVPVAASQVAVVRRAVAAMADAAAARSVTATAIEPMTGVASGGDVATTTIPIGRAAALDRRAAAGRLSRA
jgi:hypothetical protein